MSFLYLCVAYLMFMQDMKLIGAMATILFACNMFMGITKFFKEYEFVAKKEESHDKR